MEDLTYQCPNCGAPLTFHSDTQRWDCEFCRSSFTPGTIKMEYNDWQDALTMFYEQFGWDAKLGCPTRETLEKFDLADVADELAAKNLLP